MSFVDVTYGAVLYYKKRKQHDTQKKINCCRHIYINLEYNAISLFTSKEAAKI